MKDQPIKNDLPKLFQSVNWEGEKTLPYQLRQIVFQATKQAIGDKVKLDFESVKIEHPKVENYGDYSSNIALLLAGKLGVAPKGLAEGIVEKLNDYIKKHQLTSSSSDSLSHQDKHKSLQITEISPKAIAEILEIASVAGPGFVNLTIRKDYLSTKLVEVLNIDYGSTTIQTEGDKADLPLTGKKIMVEFAHPNTHKEFHIGHLRNISIGESVIRNLEAVGAKLFRANYEGDVGLHVAKAIWGVREKIKKEELKIGALRELNPANKAKFLGEGYALGSKMYDENEIVKKEIIELNKAIYKDPKKVELWEETRRWSLEYFYTVYKRLGSHFDRYFFESEVEARGKQMVIDGVKKGIFVRDKDGSIYFPGKKYGLNNCVFVTKEDYATYEGKEVALEELEFKTFPFDADIHVVANEQQNFFQIAFKAVETLFPIQKGRQFHLAYGMVNFKSGKLSSRTGQVVTADWLIDEAKKKIIQIIRKSAKTTDTSDGGRQARSARHDSSEVEESEIAEKVAVAAVKYSMLRVNPKMDIAFDLEESVTFEGDSGPYLLYTYARCKSVMRKSQSNRESKSQSNFDSLQLCHFAPNHEELSLLRTLYRFPEVVTEAVKTLSPNIICTFLFDLAQKYNLFYNKHSILQPSISHSERSEESSGAQLSGRPAKGGARSLDFARDDEQTRHFRLALTAATSVILNRGLHLLGIETVERM